MGPLTGIIPGKRVHLSEGQIVATEEVPAFFNSVSGEPVRPALVAPTLPHTPGTNRKQRRAARKKKR